MKFQVYFSLRFSIFFGLFGNAGSPLKIYEQLLSQGHIVKSLKPEFGGVLLPAGIAIRYDKNDAKILDNVEMLKIVFDQVSTVLYKAVVFEGSDLLNYYRLVNSVASVNELDIDSMSTTLIGAKRSFKTVEDNMIALQGEVHTIIETVRRRLGKLKNEIDMNEAQSQSIDGQIQILEQNTREFEQNSKDADENASRMDSHARKMEEKEESAARRGIAEIAGAAGVGVLGHALGGLGFVVYGAIVALGGLAVNNLNDASDYKKRASNFREQARGYRRKAQDLRNQVNSSKITKRELEENATYIQRQISQLETSLQKVNELSNSLRGSVDATNEIVLSLQNMVVMVTNAELDVKSLQIWFNHIPKAIEKTSTSFLKTTRSAWTDIHQLLKIHHKLLS